MAGERYVAPVAKAAEPAVSGHALTIKKLIETNDMDGLGRLMRSDPAAHATYEQMMQTGLTSAYSEVAKRHKALSAARASADPLFMRHGSISWPLARSGASPDAARHRHCGS
jgi:hypothetical protein